MRSCIGTNPARPKHTPTKAPERKVRHEPPDADRYLRSHQFFPDNYRHPADMRRYRVIRRRARERCSGNLAHLRARFAGAEVRDYAPGNRAIMRALALRPSGQIADYVHTLRARRVTVVARSQRR